MAEAISHTPHGVPVRLRVAGAMLREARLAAGLVGKDVATRLGWSATKLSRVEHGLRGTSEIDYVRLATLCGMDMAGTTRMLSLAKPADAEVWVEPARYAEATLSLLESESARATTYSPTAVPPALRTRAYARECGHAPQHPLAADNVFLLHENALRLPVGGHEVMAEQMRHLTRHRVLIVPRNTAGWCAFTRLHHPNAMVVTVPGLTNTIIFDTPIDTAPYDELLSSLTARAQDETTSRETLTRLALHHNHRAHLLQAV